MLTDQPRAIFIPAFLEDVQWLSDEERQWVMERLRLDVGDSGKEKRAVRPRDLLNILKDFKVRPPSLPTRAINRSRKSSPDLIDVQVIICGFMYFCCLVPL